MAHADAPTQAPGIQTHPLPRPRSINSRDLDSEPLSLFREVSNSSPAIRRTVTDLLVSRVFSREGIRTTGLAPFLHLSSLPNYVRDTVARSGGVWGATLREVFYAAQATADLDAPPVPLTEAELLAEQLDVPVVILRAPRLGLSGVGILNPLRKGCARLWRVRSCAPGEPGALRALQPRRRSFIFVCIFSQP